MARYLKPIPMALAAAMLAVTAAGAAAAADPEPGQKSSNACFASNTWQGWSAPGNGDVLYLRVGLRDIYKVELTPGSHVRKDADQFLINKIRGSDWICSPLDLNLTLSDHHGFQQPLIARSLRKLTPAEAAAIPRKDWPG